MITVVAGQGEMPPELQARSGSSSTYKAGRVAVALVLIGLICWFFMRRRARS